MESNNGLVTTISYTKVERIIENFEQKNVSIINHINLYTYKIETKSHSFPLENVLDISFKKNSGENGLLYLHTNQGVFMFVVETDAWEFIYAYKNLK